MNAVTCGAAQVRSAQPGWMDKSSWPDLADTAWTPRHDYGLHSTKVQPGWMEKSCRLISLRTMMRQVVLLLGDAAHSMGLTVVCTLLNSPAWLDTPELLRLWLRAGDAAGGAAGACSWGPHGVTSALRCAQEPSLA